MSGPTPSIQYSWDGPGTLGAPDAGLYLRWNNTTGRFEMASVTVPSTLDDLSDVTVTGAAQGAVLYRNASAWVHLPAGSSGQALLSGGAGANPAWGAAGVSDHGGLTGLGDDDHSQYALADKSRPATWVAASDLSGRSLADLGTRPHSLLTSLSADDHTQYALLAGRSGGQTLVGGTASGEGLALTSTSHSTKGSINFNGGAAAIASDGRILASLGSAGQPGLSFSSDADTGMYSGSANILSFAAGASSVLTLSGVSSNFNVPVRILDGTTTNGGLSFVNDSDTGLYRVGANQMGVTAGGAQVALFDAAGPKLLVTCAAGGHTTIVPLVVRVAASATANAFESQASTGAIQFRLDSGGMPHIVSNGGAFSWDGASGGTLKLGGGGTLSITDGASAVLATFIHNGGGTLRNAGTTRVQWDATGIGFFGVTPVARASAYTPTNVTTDRSFDANATTVDELADVLGTLVADLQAYGLLQ